MATVLEFLPKKNKNKTKENETKSYGYAYKTKPPHIEFIEFFKRF